MPALPYTMFDLETSAQDARRLDRMENIYHRGQDLAWNGRKVLAELVEKHGGVQVPEDKRSSLSALFGMIMWGELAAWKISLQLAERLERLGAKMAATSQAHDEARHFYVMHDYLVLATGSAPRRIYPAAEKMFADVLSADDLACKLLGMQLQVEAAALTIFQHARERQICPVLSDLLHYYEKDEARHVGLGMQYLPMLLRSMNRFERARFTAFALKIGFRMTAANGAFENDVRTLGLDPHVLLTLGKSKQTLVFEELWSHEPSGHSRLGDFMNILLQAAGSALWPSDASAGLLERAQSFVHTVKNGGLAAVETTIEPNRSA